AGLLPPPRRLRRQRGAELVRRRRPAPHALGARGIEARPELVEPAAQRVGCALDGGARLGRLVTRAVELRLYARDGARLDPVTDLLRDGARGRDVERSHGIAEERERRAA